MEYVKGDDLAKVVRDRGALPLVNACFCVHQAALGLQRGHELGLVHRDVKPGNILLSKHGKRPVIKIVDFGLAKARATAREPGDHELTGTNQMMGTPGYTAPEQLNDAKSADTRADVYGLGCTLYCLLTGEPPFKGGSAYAVLLAQETGAVKPLREVRPEIPDGLAAAVTKMMAKNPADRFQQPGEVAAALVPYIKGTKESDGGSGRPAAQSRVVPNAPAGLPEAGSRPGVEDVGAKQRRVRPKDVSAGRRLFAGRPRLAIGIVAAALLALALGLSAPIVFGVKTPPTSGRFATGADVNRDAVEQPGRGHPAPTVPATVGAGFPRPLSLDCTGPDGVSASDLRKSQTAWAQHLGRNVEETVEIANGVTITFVLVPPGKFLMGSPDDEMDRKTDETLHTVTLTKPFDLGKYEVTQAQYAALTRKNPSCFKGLDRPVEQVTWEDAREYANELTEKRSDKHRYRLPTEAEWEYCCRGGRPSSLPFGIGDGRFLSSRDANFNNVLKETCKVGSYAANALGLHDMLGNVWEWCADYRGPYADEDVTNPTGTTEGSGRVDRGGGWIDSARSLRSADRSWSVPGHRSNGLGFRLARSLPPGGK
jgi:formylglycine-generating enzyme required for sulfatase activity